MVHIIWKSERNWEKCNISWICRTHLSREIRHSNSQISDCAWAVLFFCYFTTVAQLLFDVIKHAVQWNPAWKNHHISGSGCQRFLNYGYLTGHFAQTVGRGRAGVIKLSSEITSGSGTICFTKPFLQSLWFWRFGCLTTRFYSITNMADLLITFFYL